MEKISHLSFNELVSFYQAQMGRIEQAWFRIIYLHGAMVGVLIFFFQIEETLIIQRVLAFAYYTANLLIFHIALEEGYSGLKCTIADLRKFPENDGALATWLRKQRPDFRTPARIAVLLIAWGFIAFFLFWQ